MVRNVSSKEIMTRSAAKKKYTKYYIGMVITDEKLHDTDNAMGYVAYLLDKYEEQYNIPSILENVNYVSYINGIEMPMVAEITSVWFND